MIDKTSIENALYTWIQSVSSEETIFAKPNAPRPLDPYNLIHVMSITPQCEPETIGTLQVDESVENDYSTLYTMLVSVNVFYSDAYQRATTLRDSLARVTVLEDLYTAGIGYVKTSSVNEIDAEINKEWEERAQFDCQFNVRSLDEETIESIQKIELTNNLNGDTFVIPDGSVLTYWATPMTSYWSLVMQPYWTTTMNSYVI